jgi:hypothetical protein
MGRVVPDTDHPRMWRSVKVDGLLAACGTPSAVLVEWEPPKSTKACRIATNRLRDDSLALNELQAFAMSFFVAP